MTLPQYYWDLKAKEPEYVYIIKYYACYALLYQDAQLALPICDDIMMLEYGGRNFCYNEPPDYGYPFLTFGDHNLKKLCEALFIKSIKYIIINDMKYIDIESTIQRPKSKPKPRLVQLSLFDMWEL